MKRILVIRGGAIGDFVLTLPAIKLLRDAFPNANLEIVGYKHIVALADQRFYAQATRSIEYASFASFFARGAALPAELADYFATFELVVSYLFDPDRVFEQHLEGCGVNIFLAANPKITGETHAAVQLALPLRQLDLALSDPAAVLFPSAADRESAASFLARSNAPVVALHPGSGSESKNWPLERWTELGESLLDSGSAPSLVIVGGEADQKQLRSLESVWRGQNVAFAENLPLPELAAVLSRCALFIGHDSGISHIAAAAGAPCVLLFGRTDPAVWAPMNAQVRVLRPASELLTDLQYQEVCDAVHVLMRRNASTSSSRASADGEGPHAHRQCDP